MKKIAFYFLALATIFAACEKDDDKQPVYTFSAETVDMNADSETDVYYSLSEGVVKTTERDSWDIAFSVPLQTGTILINEGAGVELYPAGDTASWESIDANTVSGVLPYYNDESSWNKGAFNHSATGHPNYGWGTYHGGTPDHNVGGDSAFVIKLTDGSFRKFMVIAKLGLHSANVIRIADLDGGNEFTDTVSTEFWSQNHFVQYSIVNREIVNAEPEKDKWDLLFTRYITKIPTGPSSYMNWPVMGVLGNPDVKIARVRDQDPEKYDEIPAEFSTKTDMIGYDWKVSDPVTHQISLVDSTSYFIQSVDGKTYQLYFIGYDGLNAGTIDFKVRTVE